MSESSTTNKETGSSDPGGVQVKVEEEDDEEDLFGDDDETNDSEEKKGSSTSEAAAADAAKPNEESAPANAKSSSSPPAAPVVPQKEAKVPSSKHADRHSSNSSLLANAPAVDPSVFGLPSRVKIPKSVTASLLHQGKLLDTLKGLPINLINDALVEYDDAVDIKGGAIRNHGAYLYGVVKRYVSVHERANSGEGTGILPMGESLTPAVHHRLEKLVTSGFCSREEMNDKVRSKIRMLSERDALFALDELSSAERNSIRNFGSYFMGILNRYMRGDIRVERGRERSYRDPKQQQQQQQPSFHRERSRDRNEDRPYDRSNNGNRPPPNAMYDNRQRQSWQGQQQQPPPPPPPMGYNMGQQQPSNNRSMNTPGMQNNHSQQQQFFQPNQQQQQGMFLLQQDVQLMPNSPGMQQLGGPMMNQQHPQMMNQQQPQMMNQQHQPQMMNQQQPQMIGGPHPPYMGNQPQPYMQQQQQQPPMINQQPQYGNMPQQGMNGNMGNPSMPNVYGQGGWQQQQPQISVDILGLADKAASAVQALASQQNKMPHQQQMMLPPSFMNGTPQNYGPPMGNQVPPYAPRQQQMQQQQPGGQMQQPYRNDSAGRKDSAGPDSRRSGRRTIATLPQLPSAVQYAVQVSYGRSWLSFLEIIMIFSQPLSFTVYSRIFKRRVL
jgi:hypothetical protein